MKSLFIAAALTLAAVAPASAQNRPFDPREYQGRHVGEATQILVIGTPHLSGTPENFDPAVLEPLLQRLQAFHPDAIAIEALPGRSIEQMWQFRESYPQTAQQYGGRAMALSGISRGLVGMDMAEANAEIRRVLADWPASPTPAQRRRLTALFVAAGEPASAIVQWWRLEPSERIADENISRLLAEQLATYETPARKNEDQLIAARLAVRLGHERVYPTDDQSDDVAPDFETNMEAFIGEPWFAALMADPNFTPLREAGQHLTTPEEALATYRFINSARTGRTDANGQWLNMINRASPSQVGRARVAAWETRNLRMIANIREVSARYPGGRILVIVGSAHKPWFDAYLSMMSDVEVVDATRVLR
ncbi:DUF5694 domain-containing protein [Candidatus Viadribacter manganicus]|uniref:TraB/GumN family protein n=1 Tax=Candidatus Viadribacter manganicus TaxID=1759059 RepID=A0A1B1AIC9_9PROT|nr:DUF5694 domain-containing protein [Candidatus Viadribacter manganicus]ANP46308.1 hypothetical protein ATE48_10460 [Candidatus Viadribacter manganicus]